MDYIEVFQNLRYNNKYGRKSPHKAVLMLTVIEMLERNILSNNEVYYDDKLKSMFLKVWNKVMPDSPLFHSEAYLPYWYLQSDSFWHIVPVRGKEEILSLMRDTNIKPSEPKLEDCVRYAELDEDLYFMMTLPSGRSSLKRVLLETYTQLSEMQIEKFAVSSDNNIDYSISALSDYEKFNSNEDKKKNTVLVEADGDLVRQFLSLNEDIQIVFNLQYYSFLKSHRNEREMLKAVCPTVYDLLDKIVNNPINQGEISPSFAFTYDNFLSDLKIALMSEEESMELIDKIGEAIKKLRGNNNVEITTPIVEIKDLDILASDSEEEVCADEEDVLPQDYIIENHANRCCIIDNRGVQVFSSSGKLIRLNNIFYGISYSDSLVSMTIIKVSSKGAFSLGRRIIAAHKHSSLYASLDKQNYVNQFKAVKYDSDSDKYYVQVENRWYGSLGYYADFNDEEVNKSTATKSFSESKTAPLDNKETSDPENGSSPIDSDVGVESRRGKAWTQEEEELVMRYFNNGKDTSTIASMIGRTEVAIKARLAKLGLIEYTYGQEEEGIIKLSTEKEDELDKDGFRIENSFTRCSIFNKDGERVFSSEGKLKYINGKLYRLNLKKECFTVKEMNYINGLWVRGDKKIVAYPKAQLYPVLEKQVDYCLAVEDIDDNLVFEKCRIRVVGEWYCYDGTPEFSLSKEDDVLEETPVDDVEEFYSQFSVRMGDTLKVFPTQVVGKVVKLRVDKAGHKKIIVKSTSGDVVEIYDSKYLYQKIGNQEKVSKKTNINEKKNEKSGIDQHAEIGIWIKMKSDGVIGQVINKFSAGSIKRMIVRTQSGYEIECDDNKDSYEIIKGTSKTTREIKRDNNVTSPTNELGHQRIIRVGDWIKTNFFNDKCQVIRIEKNGSFYEKLIVKFEDGREDWIINKPDLYKIVATAPVDEGINKDAKVREEVRRAAKIGDRVIRLSDNLVGTVVGIKPLLAGIEKLILELEDGKSAEVFNDLQMYKVIL